MNYVNGAVLILSLLILGFIWNDVRGVHTGTVEMACSAQPVQVPALENNGTAIVALKCQYRR